MHKRIKKSNCLQICLRIYNNYFGIFLELVLSKLTLINAFKCTLKSIKDQAREFLLCLSFFKRNLPTSG